MNPTAYKHNFFALIWHALFLAFASTFIDVNTVLSSFILNVGGSSIHIGVLTGITVGIPMVTQLLFAGFLAGRTQKKPYLLVGIYLRVLALVGMGYTLSVSEYRDPRELMFMIFLWIGIFSISGAFASVSYTDILGKTFIGPQRDKFLVFKQFISASGMLISALVVRRLVNTLPYPENYAVIFLTAAGLLFVATFGFLMLKETVVKNTEYISMFLILKSIPRRLRSDKNLVNYIILINLTGLGLTTIPFYVAYSKSLFGLGKDQIGNYILLLFIGMIFSTIIWTWVAKRFRFKGIAYGSAITGSMLPLIALFLAGFGPECYQWIFFMAGLSVSAQKIFVQGMLLEITKPDNRAVYAGIAGALSVTTALFPLIAGTLIEIIGFNLIFIAISPFVISSLYFLKKIECDRP